MIFIRPISQKDYPALYDIAVESGHGFTSLPVSEELLSNKIKRSETSFQSTPIKPGDQGYLFVMEDSESGEIVGTSGIEAAVGLDSPFYHYHLGKVVHSSTELKVHNTVETLTLCNDNTGLSEICTLFLRSSHRKDGNGRFLSRFRFLFMAEHEKRFGDQVIAEMRGVSDENGRSPFWAWLEEHFFSIDFPTADYLTGIGNKVFIAELMPKYPIYVNLLSDAAQSVINKVHTHTEPALRLLQAEGFNRSGYVDIFDAGPTISAQKNAIKTVSQSESLVVKITDRLNLSDDLKRQILCNTKVPDFRAVQADVLIDRATKSISLTSELADILLVSDGDSIRAISN